MTHAELTVRGLRRHVAMAGPEDGHPVFLHHGWPQHFYEWRFLMPALAAAGFRVVAPDSRGFGWTEYPPDEDFSHAAFVADAVALCRELGFERIHYVGHDWGAFFGFRLCLEWPELVERAVLLSAPHPWPPEPAPNLDTLRRLSRLAYQLPLAAPGVPRAARRALFPLFAQAGHEAGFEGWELEAYMAPLRLPSQVRATTLLYRNNLLREVRPVAEGKYRGRRLEVPTLYLMGENEPIIDDEMFHGLRDHGDDVTTHVVPGAGHFVPDEAPEEVRRLVLSHLGASGGVAHTSGSSTSSM